MKDHQFFLVMLLLFLLFTQAMAARSELASINRNLEAMAQAR